MKGIKHAPAKPERTLLTLIDQGYDGDLAVAAAKPAPLYLKGDKVVRTTAYGGAASGHGLGEIGTFVSYDGDGVSACVLNSEGTTVSWHLDKFTHAVTKAAKPALTLSGLDKMLKDLGPSLKPEYKEQMFMAEWFTPKKTKGPKPPGHMTHYDKWFDAWVAACCLRFTNLGPTEWYTQVDQDHVADRWLFRAYHANTNEVLLNVKVTHQVWSSVSTPEQMFGLLSSLSV